MLAWPAWRASAQEASGPVRLDLAVGPAWRETQYDPIVPSWGVGAQFGILIPSLRRTALYLSIAPSGFPGAVVLVNQPSARIPLAKSVARAVSLATAPIDGGSGLTATTYTGEYRWYANPRQSGAFLGVGAGFVDMSGGHDSEWAGLIGISAGYAFHPAGSAGGPFVEGRINQTSASGAPRWLVPLVIGWSWSLGG
jgi:hypothetical protein